jgi:cytochrome b involved in lipid metabolism
VDKKLASVVIAGIFVFVLIGILFIPSLSKPPISSESVVKSAVTELVETNSNQSKFYSLAEVAQHKDQSSCWSIINSKVYDLTAYLGKHPGGKQRIMAICGKDGTMAFGNQHDNQPRPELMLSSFKIGELQR